MGATYAQFLADPNRVENYVFEVVGYDIFNFVEVPMYFCTSLDGFATLAGDTPANQLFDARMASGFSRRTGLAGGNSSARGFAGFIPQERTGVITVTQFFGDLDIGDAACTNFTPLRDLSFGGRLAVVKHGGSCKFGDVAYEDYRVIMDGECAGSPRIYPDRVEFEVRGKDARFEHPVQSRTLFGTFLCGIFNGTSSYVDAGATGFNYTASDFSVSFMVFIESNPGSPETIISKGEFEVDGWDVVLRTTGAVRFRTHQSGASQFTDTAPLPLNRWVQVDIARDGSVVTINVDGLDDVVTAGTHINPTSTARNLYIGRDDSGTTFFRGALDEVRITDEAYSDDDFDDFLHRPLETDEYADYELYMNFDDGFGATTFTNLGTQALDTNDFVDVDIRPSCMGTEDMQGRRMPDVWGQVKGYQPMQVDFAEQIYMVHSSAIQGVPNDANGNPQIFLNGHVAYVEGASSPYTSWLDFIVAETATGEVDICNNAGWTFIRLGGQPEATLSMLVLGDKSDGTYRTTLASIMRYIISTRGNQPLTDPTDLDETAWDLIETMYPDDPAAVNLSYADDRTIRDVLDAFCRTAGLWCFFKRSDGLLTIKQLGDPSLETPIYDLTNHHVGRGSLRVLDRGVPVWHTIGRYKENPVVLGDGDLFPDIDPAQANYFRRQWRKKELKRLPTKERHLDAGAFEFEMRFINPVAAKTEVHRISVQLRTLDQAFSIFCPLLPVEIELLDVVTFHYQDEDRHGNEQSRLSTSADAEFYIVGIHDDAKRGGYVIDLWRPQIVN